LQLLKLRLQLWWSHLHFIHKKINSLFRLF